MIFPVTVFLSGCYTTRTEMVIDEQIPIRLSGKADKDIEIISLKLNSGEVISLKEKDAKFFLNYRDMQNVICYTSSDTIKLNGEISKVVYTDRVFQLNDIKYIKIETSKLNVGMTVLITTGVILLALLTILVISVGTMHSN
jgi:hypothetical protein